jgi:DNA-directed RNA polymerase specialized sigma subunit
MFGNHEILRAVRAAAKAAWYAGNGRLDRDTCTSEAHEAVVLAMHTFDPAKGASLSTYSANRARWQAQKLVNRPSATVSMPMEWFDSVPAPRSPSLKEMFDGLEFQVVSLSVESRYTHRQIAGILKISYYRVNQVMKQVRKKVREWENEN